MFWLSLLLCFVSANANMWILTVETDSNWMAGFVGDVTVCFTYKPLAYNYDNETLTPLIVKHEECQSLPIRKFVRGKTDMLTVELSQEIDTVEEIKLFSKPTSTSICKRKSVSDSWHIKSINFQDMRTGNSYEVIKRFPVPFIVQQRCSEGHELILNEFNVTVTPRPCPIFGGVYQSGEYFDDGCSSRCQCRDGMVGCVSMCPPSIAMGCREVYVPGECCQQHICENKPQYYPSCPLYEEGDCEMTKRTVAVGEFPWTAFVKICDNESCKFCSGAIINENYVLTSGSCVRSAGNYSRDIKVILGENALSFKEDSKVEMLVENVTFSSNKQSQDQLAMIKLQEPIAFHKTVQPATLPLNRQQCLMLTRPKCASTMTGWVNVDDESQQYELYKLSVNIADNSECGTTTNINNSGPMRKRKPMPPSIAGANPSVCIDLANNESPVNSECGCASSDNENSTSNGCPSDKNAYLCSGEVGRILTSKMQVPTYGQSLEINYVVGVVTQSLSTDNCKKSASNFAVHVCNDLDWITQTLYSYYHSY